MNTPKLLRALATALALAGAAAAPALAQMGPPPSEDDAGPTMGPGRDWPKPSERVEARIAYVKAALKITDAQQPQFDALAEVMRRHATQMDARFAQMRDQRGRGQSMTAIERLEQRRAFMSQGAEMLNEMLAAAKPLYAALDADQKKIADDLVGRSWRGKRGGHGSGPMHGPF